jgi:carboxylesterase
LDLNPFFLAGGPVGCLLIHGGTGSPPEMRPMGQYLAAQGLTVLGVRLAGHGTVPEDLAGITWRDLVRSAEDGLDELQHHCTHVFVAGLSMGGSLTLYLAAHRSIAGAIAMSTPAYINDWRLKLLPVVKLFVKWHAMNDELDLTDPSARQMMSFYRRIPVTFAQEVQSLMREVRASLPAVQVPVLVMQGRFDRSIPADSAEVILESLGARDKEIVWWSNSGHAITVDTECEAVWARAYAFIAAHVPS